MSCSKKYVPNTKFAGEQGPPGPAGPPGAGANREDLIPWFTSEIEHDGTERNGDTLKDIIDGLLYVPLQIPSFTLSTPIYEMGQSVASLSFNWTFNKAVVSQSIAGVNYSSGPMAIGLRTIIGTISPAITTDSVYTLTANDGTNTVNRNVTARFLNKMYFGARTAATIDSNFIKSLANAQFAESRARTFTVNAGASQYIYFAYPTRFGVATIFVGGFETTFEQSVVSFTNDSGFTENYYVYKSFQPNLGSSNVIVS